MLLYRLPDSEEVMIKNKNALNVKPGDMIKTSVGIAILLKQTRAHWFYLFKSRTNSLRKSEFWRMVDLGQMQIIYAKGKKYRRVQKTGRTLDIRGLPVQEISGRVQVFSREVNLPFSIASDHDDKIINEVLTSVTTMGLIADITQLYQQYVVIKVCAE